MLELNQGEVQEILRVFADSDLQELHLEVGNTKLVVSKNGPPATVLAQPTSPTVPVSEVAARSEQTGAARRAVEEASGQPAGGPQASGTQETTGPAAVDEAPAATGERTDGLFELKSPLVGVFYRRPAPDKPPYVEVGSEVEEDDPVCIVSVMKMFTEVTAQCRGRIAEILVEDDTLVEHGQTLMLIEPA